jgi:hypothetical protein
VDELAAVLERLDELIALTCPDTVLEGLPIVAGNTV